MSNKEVLLTKYKKVWAKIDILSKQTDDILKVSPMGQAPQCFHDIVSKQLRIIENEVKPLWDELKNFIKDDFKTYWQYTNWRLETLPPCYNELGISLN